MRLCLGVEIVSFILKQIMHLVHILYSAIHIVYYFLSFREG